MRWNVERIWKKKILPKSERKILAYCSPYGLDPAFISPEQVQYESVVSLAASLSSELPQFKVKPYCSKHTKI